MDGSFLTLKWFFFTLFRYEIFFNFASTKTNIKHEIIFFIYNLNVLHK